MDALEEALAVRRVRAYLRDGKGREARVRAGLSQADVAREVGTDIGQVARWELGRHVPGRASALKLARLYGELEKLIAIEAAADAVAAQLERGETGVAPGAVTADTGAWEHASG